MTGSATKCNEVSGPLYHALLLAEKFPNRGGVRGGEGQIFCRVGRLADDGKRNEVQRSEWTVVLALLLGEKS